MKTNLSPKTQNRLGCLVAAAGIFLVFLFIAAAWLYNSIIVPFREMNAVRENPVEISDARIITSADFLEKSELFRQKELSWFDLAIKSYTIRDQREREMVKNSEISKNVYGVDDLKLNPATDEIVLAGRFGAQFLDRVGNLKREILFEPTEQKINVWGFELTNYKQDFGHYKIVDLESDGRMEFLAFGGLDGIAVFDEEGKALWRFGRMNLSLGDVQDDKKWEEEHAKNPPISTATVADLDADGTEEIILTRENDEIRAFRKDGTELWREPSEIPGDELWTFDLNNDKKAEIVELFSSKPLIRQPDGKPIKQIEIDYGACQDVLLSEDKKLQFLGVLGNKLRIVDESGEEILSADAPLSEIPISQPRKSQTPIRIDGHVIAVPMNDKNTEQTHNARAVRVGLRKGESKYLAVVAPYRLFDRTIFYLYNSEGKLVYHEILPEDARVITALPLKSGLEGILISGKNTVWRYNAK